MLKLWTWLNNIMTNTDKGALMSGLFLKNFWKKVEKFSKKWAKKVQPLSWLCAIIIRSAIMSWCWALYCTFTVIFWAFSRIFLLYDEWSPCCFCYYVSAAHLLSSRMYNTTAFSYTTFLIYWVSPVLYMIQNI